MLIYFLIFISKIIENTLSTLRLILVANGKKKLGAILNGIIGLVWIFIIGIVIKDINKDIFKIIFFVLGSIVGSYLGSIIEEKIALGTNILYCITKKEYKNSIKRQLNNYKITSICEENKDISILLIMIKRKEIHKITNIINNIDKSSIIISEKAKFINNMV